MEKYLIKIMRNIYSDTEARIKMGKITSIFILQRCVQNQFKAVLESVGWKLKWLWQTAKHEFQQYVGKLKQKRNSEKDNNKKTLPSK